MSEERDGLYTLLIPRLAPAEYDRLAVIITRMDADERANPMGGYTVTLEPTPETDDGDGVATSR